MFMQPGAYQLHPYCCHVKFLLRQSIIDEKCNRPCMRLPVTHVPDITNLKQRTVPRLQVRDVQNRGQIGHDIYITAFETSAFFYRSAYEIHSP